MTRKPSRTRRIAKWTGVVACAVIAVAWVVSLWAPFEYITSDTHVGLRRGCLFVARIDLEIGNGFRPLSRLRPFWIPEWVFARSDWIIFVPLWIPLVLIALPTFILWLRDRRHPRGHCQRCGYNLTGNVSGRCPECGHKAMDVPHETGA